MPPTRKTALAVYTKLAGAYGDPAPTHPRGKPLDVLVETILSQHTSDKNSHRAYLSLRKAFPRWEQVVEAPVRDIEHAIRAGGLARQKSIRIQTVLGQIREREGRITLARLSSLSSEEIYTYLTSFPGVGAKTACCVLLFSMSRSVMPVDTHIHRIIKRLGWIPTNGTPDHVRAVLESHLPPDSLYHAHVLLIAHGRRTCLARNPRCDACPIRRQCAYVILNKRPQSA